MVQITFRPDGTIEHIGDDQSTAAGIVAEIAGRSTKRRASHIEPCSPALRVAFHAVRWFGERAVAWTRSWPCLWRVRIVGGPTFGEYRDRSAAIAAEVAWLENHRL